jgi:hypothetical protein
MSHGLRIVPGTEVLFNPGSDHGYTIRLLPNARADQEEQN